MQEDAQESIDEEKVMRTKCGNEGKRENFCSRGKDRVQGTKIVRRS